MTNYKFSIGMPSLEIEDNYQYLNWAKEAGFGAVECEIAHPYLPAVRKTVKDGLDKFELDLSGIRTGISYYLEGLCLSSKDSKVVESAIERLVECNSMLAEYPHALNLIGLMQGRLDDMNYYSQARKQIIDGLKKICASAEKLNIKVSLEAINHLQINYHNTVESVIKVIEDVGSPALGLLIDTFHMNIEEKSIDQPVLMAGKLINHVHVADSNRWAPGQGHIDFNLFFDALSKIGYSGWITVEADPKPDFQTMATDAMKYINSLYARKGIQKSVKTIFA